MQGAYAAIDNLPNISPIFHLFKRSPQIQVKIIYWQFYRSENKIIDSLHNSELGWHSREQATYQRNKLLFHWPGLKQQVIAFIKQCPVCQINKSEHCKYPGLLQPLPVPDFAWTHVSMDFVEGLHLSEHKDLILVVVDRFTKYAHFISMKHPISVQLVVRAFREIGRASCRERVFRAV